MHVFANPLRVLQILVLLSLVSGLLLSACGGQASLDLNLDGQSGNGGNGSNGGTITNSTLIVLLVIIAVVVLARRG